LSYQGKTRTFYHGTNSTVLDSIMQRGLVVPDRTIDFISLTRDRDSAKKYAWGTVRYHRFNGEPIVIEVVVPENEIDKVVGTGDAVVVKGNVPKSWIKGVHYIRSEPFR